jgi:hypothetical protein
MQTLSSGYRVVGGLSAVYAAVMAGLLVSGAANSPNSWPRDALNWFLAVLFVLSPLALVVAGVLLYTKQAATLRAARWALGIAGVLLLLKAFVVTLAVVQEFKHSTSSTGVLIVVLVPMIITPASIWAVVVLVTSISLDRHLRSQGAAAPQG